MYDTTTKVILFALVVSIVFLFYKKYVEVSYVKSNVDNNHYIIRNNYEKFKVQENADILAEINKRIESLISHLIMSSESHSRYLGNRLRSVYNHKVISEAAFDTRYTTFTIDKQDMHICLRTRDDHKHAYDINILMYVVLHELAHMVNYNQNNEPIIGHGREFQKIFKLLVKEAIVSGIYIYQNYKTNPQEYCGITINSNILSY